MDAQETCTLCKGGWAETRNFEQLAAILETAVFIAVGDDIFCRGGIDACDMAQQCRRGSVQINAYMVDGRFNRSIECAGKFSLIDIMLILSDADGLRVNLDEFSQGILYAPGNGNRTEAPASFVIR